MPRPHGRLTVGRLDAGGEAGEIQASPMGLVAILSFGACMLALLVACRVVLRVSDNPPAAWALAFFLVSTAAFVADQIAYQQDWFASFPHFFAVANPFIAAIFPSLFLYVRGVTHPTIRWSQSSLGHFAPALLLGLLEIPTYLLSAEEKTAAARAQLTSGSASTDELFSLALLNLYALGYLLATWRTLRNSRARLVESAEEGRTPHPRGLESFVLIFLFFTATSGVLDFTPWRFSGSLMAALAAVVAVYATVWLITDHQPLFAPREQPGPYLPPTAPAELPPFPQPVPESALPLSPPDLSPASEPFLLQPTSPPALVPPPIPPPAPNSQPSPETHSAPVRTAQPTPLRPAEIDRLQRKLEKLFRDDRIHLDADLSLQSLAARTETTRHKMSAAIRTLYGLTFYQLIARYRVRDAARLLQARASAQRTIADIAFSVGFNTLSAFNAAFKAEFGLTPSRFRENPSAGDRPASNLSSLPPAA